MVKKVQKKKLPVKKVSDKKTITQKRTNSKQVQPMAMAMIPIDQINQVETYKGKMSVVPTPFTERQILQLISPTPKNVILKRPGKGGKQFDYLPGWWFRKKLNFTFGWMHDFEILGERIDGDFITVKGRLTIKDKAGKVLVSKTDFGGHPVTFMKDKPHKPEFYLDISNDFKAASTDCMKRCAVQLGIGLDVYSAGEYANPTQPEAPAESVVVEEMTQPIEQVVHKAEVIEAEARPVAKRTNLEALNTRLEQLGYKSNSTKAEFVSTKAKMMISATKWSKLTEGEAQMLIAVLKKLNIKK